MSRDYVGDEIVFDDSGMEDFEKMLKEYAQKANPDNVVRAMDAGAQELINDLLKLPRPRRQIEKSGYTHLVESFAKKRTRFGVQVGWGKYYGPMVENGTMYMNAQPHLRRTFEQNAEKYSKTMQHTLFG